MARWKVSITWIDGGDGSTWCVEAFQDSQRIVCVVVDTDSEDVVHHRFEHLAHALKDRVAPTLFD